MPLLTSYHAIWIFMIIALSPGVATADIMILNPGFEEEVLPDGFFIGSINGWSISGTGGAIPYGVYDIASGRICFKRAGEAPAEPWRCQFGRSLALPHDDSASRFQSASRLTAKSPMEQIEYHWENDLRQRRIIPRTFVAKKSMFTIELMPREV